MALGEQMRRDGVVVLRDVFTPSEIARLRGHCESHLRARGLERKGGKHEPFPRENLPEIDWVYGRPALREALREIAGRPVQLAGCDVHMSQFLGWHKDLGEVPGGTFAEDHFASDAFAIYKVGIYLQDHTERGGLTVRLGSHRSRELDVGQRRYVATRPGDVTVIDVRLSHIGLEPTWIERFTLRLGDGLGRGGRPHPLGRRLREWLWRTTGRDEKIGIFLTFGVDDAFTSAFQRLWDEAVIAPDY